MFACGACVCRSHVGECCAGHVPYSSPNLHATNIYFFVFCWVFFLFSHAPLPKGPSMQTYSRCLKHSKPTMPCLLVFSQQNFIFIYFLFSSLFRKSTLCFHTSNKSHRFISVLCDRVSLLCKQHARTASLISWVSLVPSNLGPEGIVLQTLHLWKWKGQCLFSAGGSQCSNPGAAANVLLHWIEGILQRGHELLRKTSEWQLKQTDPVVGPVRVKTQQLS